MTIIRWDELLEHLFCNRSETLRPLLQWLPSSERLGLFKRHKKDLLALRQCCYFLPPLPGEENTGDYSYLKPRYAKIFDLYQALLPQATALADWLTTERISAWGAKDIYTLFLNLDTCWALLCDKRSASLLSKRLYEMPFADYDTVWDERGTCKTRKADAPEPWIYSVSQALLWRDESWADEILLRIFTQMNLQCEGGFYRAVATALAQRPAQAEWWNPLGKALNLELWIYGSELCQLPPAHIKAMLSWIPPESEELRHLDPLVYSEVQQYVQQWAQDPTGRQDLLDLIRKRLQTHTRPARNLTWIKLWKVLAPKASELQAHELDLLRLAQSPHSNALQVGLQAFKSLLQEKSAFDHPEEWQMLLLHYVQHPVQKIAKESLQLLKRWVKRYPEREAVILNGLGQQLLTPHSTVRTDLYRWLQNTPLSDTAHANLQLLFEDPALPPLEREDLRQRFPQLQVLTRTNHSPPHTEKAQDLLIETQVEYAVVPAPALDTHGLMDPLPLPTELESLLDLFLSQASGPVQALALECLMQAVLNIPLPKDPLPVAQYLDPLLKILRVIDEPAAHNAWHSSWQNGRVAVLAWGWLHKGALYPFQHDSSFEHLFTLAHNAQAQQILITLQALQIGAPARLSQPDTLSGWITPEHLVERLRSLPPALITHAELEQTLYALAPISFTPYWQALQSAFKPLDKKIQQILTIACGADTEAKQATREALQYFKQSPPQATVLFSGFDAPVFENTPADLHFQLFTAALAARQNRPNYCAWEILQDLPLENLGFDLGVDYSELNALFATSLKFDTLHWEEDTESNEIDQRFTQLLAKPQRNHRRLQEMPEPFQALIKEALLTPAPLSLPLNVSMNTEMSPHITFQLQLNHYRNLYPYVLGLQNTPQWLSLNALPEHWYELVAWLWPHPGQAERLFRAALLKVGQSFNPPETRVRLDKKDLNWGLLALGQLPWIPLAEVLPQLIQALLSPHMSQRHVILSVVEAGLDSQRISPQLLAETLTNQLLGIGKGFRYLQDAMQQIQQRNQLGEYLMLYTLESYFCRLGSAQPQASGVLSSLLEQAYQLCQLLQRGIENACAQQTLKSLADQKKKSIGRDKARLLLALPAIDSAALTARMAQG